jgi:tetratricopeptide (TPR) repeat protein
VKDFFGQLQERHVLRTAVLYLGAGWVALEFIGFVVENYGFYRTVLDCSLLLIGIGFPVALIISWYHGAGGRQRVPRSEGLMVGALILVGLVGSGVILTRDRPEPRSPTLAPAGLAPEDLGQGSLAVLPLTNRTGADSLDWLGPGLADMLTTNLAQLEGLRVVSAQRLLDLMRQAGRGETEAIPDDLALQIASQSGARTLVRGSFMAVGDEVRVDVQLIDLEDGTITAAEQARGSDVFALVDDVSARLSGQMLGPAFTPTELTPVTQLATGNIEAYKEYQEGLLAERRFLFEQAEGRYRRAVELDPEFAIAWLRLGMLGNVTGQEALLAFQNADNYKDGASERDRYMIEAMFAANFQRDVPAADSLLRELIEKFPEEKEARYQLGVFYDATDRDEEGRVIIREAVRLDPYYAPGINHLAYMAGRAGDSAEADSLSLRYLEIEPGQANPHDSRGEILEMIGRTEDARAEFQAALEIEPGFLASFDHLVRSYLREGDTEGARAALEPHLGTEDADAAVYVRRLLGDTYVADGSYRDALASWRSAAELAVELNRQDLQIQPLLAAGQLATLMGAYDEAEASYREADAIDPLLGGVMFGLLTNSGERGRVNEMLQVRDTVVARFADVPPIMQGQVELITLLVDGLVAWYRGDAQAAVQLWDEARELAGAPRPALVGPSMQESMALIHAGRAREALAIAENMERISQAGNRLNPGMMQGSLYLQGRAHEALDDPSEAGASYEKLLGIVGDGVEEIVILRDVRARLAATRAAASSQSGTSDRSD